MEDPQPARSTTQAPAREGGDADAAGVRGTRNLFRKEFGHLSQAAQDRFKEDSLWMGQAEKVLRGDEANRLRGQMKRGLSKGLNVKLVHRKPTFQELAQTKPPTTGAAHPARCHRVLELLRGCLASRARRQHPGQGPGDPDAGGHSPPG